MFTTMLSLRFFGRLFQSIFRKLSFLRKIGSLGLMLPLLWVACQSDPKTDINGGWKPVVPPNDTATLDSSSVKLKVMSYNIKGGDLASSSSKDAVAAVIIKVNPEVVLLQEVYNGGSIGTLPRYLAEKAGYPYYYFAQAFVAGKGPYGNAILSKYPLLETRADTLYASPVDGVKQERRVLGQATIVKEGRRIRLAVMHLGVKAQNNYEQALVVVPWLNQSNDPVIFGGDANAKPYSSTYNELVGSFTRMCAELGSCGNTFPNVNPTSQIDYLLVGPRAKNHIFAFRTQTFAIMQGETASDHCPIVGETIITYLQ